ncbi:MAG: hypothetical protein Q8876_06725 [Bacillota bacterium]|nr:hypothetical protein [Bacillota bacterium]
MKLAKKLTALLLAVILVVSLASCNSQAEWSYKTNDDTLSIGTYIFYLYSFYQQASQKVSDSSKDVLSQTITDDDTNKKVNASDWIKKSAKQSCLNLLATYYEFKKDNLKLTSTETKAALDNTSQAWSQEGSQFEGYGISKDSYNAAANISVTMDKKIFKHMFDVGGTNAVSDADLKAYFLKNYTDYDYLPINLYSTSSSTSSTSSESSQAVAFTDAQVKQVVSTLQKYVDKLNKGETFANVKKAYMTDLKTTSDPFKSGTEYLKNSQIGADLIKGIGALSVGKASLLKVGTGNSAVEYLIYKGDINAKVNMLSDSTTRYEALVNDKSQDFTTYMKGVAKKISCQSNDNAITKYDPSMFKQ